MITPELWKYNILEEVRRISDKSYQEKSWFGKSEEISSLDEMYNTLFDDFMFDDFLNSERVELTPKQQLLGNELKNKLELYYPNGVILKESDVIDDPKWGKVRAAARDFLNSFGA